MIKVRTKNTLLLLALVIATIFMGIGYSAINSITGDITGKATANNQDGVFITDVEYVSDIDANLNNSKIENFLGTMMKSTVELSESNTKSEIKYKVTVYNNAVEAAVFEKVTYGEEFYDNEEITYEIEGFTPGQTIGSKETKEIIITFKYKDQTTVPANKILNSYLNFEMIVPNRMVLAQKGDNTSKYLTGSILKNQIESVKFKKGEEPTSTDILASFDASEKQDESIMAYYTDTDGDGLYELTFASDGIIAANEDAKYLFQNLIKLAKINFENFSTYGVTNMRYMFYYCSSLTTLDLRKFDTSKVTSMKFMFYNCSSLTTLDVSKFNTSNVTEMISMFGGCSGLTTLDVSKFNTSKVTNMTSMFFGCTSLTKLDLSSYSTSSITAISGMFQNCSSLTTIDLSKFDISKVTNLNAMFSGCSSLTTIYVSEFNSETNTGWTTSAVTNSSNMFSNCTKIVGGNGTTFNSSYTDKTYAVIDKTGTPGYLTNIKDKP